VQPRRHPQGVSAVAHSSKWPEDLLKLNGLVQQLFRRKDPNRMLAESDAGAESGGLKRSVGLIGLTSLGVGAVIGTGIFFILSVSVPLAGPAVIWSFLLAAVVAGLTAICYAEMAGAVPISGSSYSYTYATLGELAAIIVGSCLILEWGVATAAVVVGWSEYVNDLLLTVFHWELPYALSNTPEEGGIVNIPALVLILMCALLLVRGASESITVNVVMVIIKFLVLGLFIVIGLQGFNAENLHPFAPYGVAGISTAAGVIYFSFVGLDGVATAGEEAKNPKRNLPLAILLTLVIVTAVYMAVAFVAVTAQEQSKFEGQSAGLSKILQDVSNSGWPSFILTAGAIISIFSVTMVGVYGQTRILFAMSRDGMIPKVFHDVSRKTMVPVKNTVIVSLGIGGLAAFVPLGFLTEMTSVGTLVAFITVSVGVIVLRKTQPKLPRSFKVPFFPVAPILAIAGSLWIVFSLRSITLVVFLVWIAGTLVWYFSYSRKHSKLQQEIAAAHAQASTQAQAQNEEQS
jgi:APA family basic amino acid/polyamine antiporter